MGVMWCPSVVLICIYLMISDIEMIYVCSFKRNHDGTSLVVQWLRMQGTWVRSLVGELRSHMPLGKLSPRLN